jgi:hypothetical protein
MKKRIFHLLLALLLSGFNNTWAQENNERFELGLNGGHELSNPAWSIGANALILFPLKNGNYITAGVYYDRLKEKYKYVEGKSIYNQLALQAGYRKMINSFFIEPLLGIGYTSEHYQYGNSPGTTRSLALAGGFMGGVYLGRFTLSTGFRFLVQEGLILFGEGNFIGGVGIGIRF